MNELVKLQVGDRVGLRKDWEKYAQSDVEIRIVNEYIDLKKWYTVDRIDNEIEQPIIKIRLGKTDQVVPFYYTRAMFRKYVPVFHSSLNQS